jgi:glycerol uptake facilitator protein
MVAQRVSPGGGVALEAPLGRRLGAEFLGTLLLVAIGAGTVAALSVGPLARLQAVSDKVAELQPGSAVADDPVVRGLFTESGIVGSLPVALAFGFGLAVLVYALGGVSGAHFNPAVSFGLAVARRFSWGELPLYWIAQVAGGIAGAFIVVGIFNSGGPADAASSTMYGATVVTAGVEQWNAILAEAFIAFILMFAVMGVAIDPRAPKGWSGLVIGLALAAGIMVTGPATGGSANFARSLGPMVASMVKGINDIPWKDLIAYAAGPLVGAAAAALIYDTVTGLETASPAPSPGAATHDEDLYDRPVTASGGSTVPPGLAPTGETSAPRTPPGLAPTSEDPLDPGTKF